MGVYIVLNEYRIDNNMLHKKKLGKNALTDIIIRGSDSTTPWAGTFFHYTSPEGLIGILESRTLFFTDCQYLNDYSERLTINTELDLFWHNNQRNYDKEFLKLIKNIRVDKFEDTGFSYMDEGDVLTNCRYFVLSATHDKDSLSMWKYYAKNNTYNGYCLGLTTWALVDEWIDRETGVAIEEGDVIYSSNDKQIKILKAVEKLYLLWCTYKISNELNQKIIDEFRSWTSITSLFFKHECFSTEQEYRFVAISPVDKLKELYYEYNQKRYKMYDFRIVNGVLTPYIKMPFNFWNTDECWAVSSIGIGPSINAIQMENGLKQFLKSFTYKIEDCKIYHSRIPLRY